MAEQKKNDDPVKKVKTEATKIFKDICDDLIEQEVFNTNQMRNMKIQFSSIKDRSEDLVKTVTHKSGQIGQIVLKRLLTATRQLHSGIQAEDENSEPIENAGISQTVASLLLAPRPIQTAEPLNKVKLNPTDFYHELKEAKDEEEMKSVLEEFADRPEHQSSDSTFFVFMSHGTNDVIFGINHKQEDPDILANDTIFEIFNNSNCYRLRHKPKVIIIHGCQVGMVSEQSAVAASAGSCAQSSKDDKKIFWKDTVGKEHVEKDFICFHSTTPYDISLEDDQVGSLFISLFIDCFQQYSWCCHVEEVFQKVQKSFETSQDPIQMLIIERLSMTRYLYLFPGI
ncbi:caspase-13-like isoform X3 [Vombatus ursinus]|uniref:caspase-13-like isoform X3 n=1 Tax=Vombatus ursinus TaxID=29139 RepID=UPI000FFDAAEE|nr:caspase-13-like isoform X3 [Vombatus ursinus]